MSFKAYYEEKMITDNPESVLQKERTNSSDIISKNTSSTFDMNEVDVKQIATHPDVIEALKTVYSIPGRSDRDGAYSPERAVGMLKRAAEIVHKERGYVDERSYINKIVDWLKTSALRGKGRPVNGLDELPDEVLDDLNVDTEPKDVGQEEPQVTNEPIEDETMDNEEVPQDTQDDTVSSGPFYVTDEETGEKQEFDSLEAAREAAGDRPVTDANGEVVDELNEEGCAVGAGPGTTTSGVAPFAARMSLGLQNRKLDEPLAESVGNIDYDKVLNEDKEAISKRIKDSMKSIFESDNDIEDVSTDEEIDEVLEEFNDKEG